MFGKESILELKSPKYSIVSILEKDVRYTKGIEVGDIIQFNADDIRGSRRSGGGIKGTKFKMYVNDELRYETIPNGYLRKIEDAFELVKEGY